MMHYGRVRPIVWTLCSKAGTHVDNITTDIELVTCQTCIKIMKRRGMYPAKNKD